MKYSSILTQTLCTGLLTTVPCLPIYATDTTDDQLTVTELIDMSLEELMNINVVSATTGSKQIVSKAPAIVTVITADQIAAMGAKDLDEVLQTVPELHVMRSEFAYDPLYLLRGNYHSTTSNPSVLVLINNIPINLVRYGDKTRIWAGMPVNAIARVEVIRGSGAVVHADAFAGAINIVTKNANDIKGTETGMSVGSFNTIDTWVSHGGRYHGLEVAATLEYQDTEGQREIITADNQTASDQKFGTHTSLAPGPVNVPHRNYDARLDVAGGDWRWRAGLQQRQHVGMGVGIYSALDPLGRSRSQGLNTDLTYHQPHLTPHWEVTAQGSYFRNLWGSEIPLLLLPPGSGGGAFPEGTQVHLQTTEQHWRFNLSAFYTGLTNHIVRLETGYVDADISEVKLARNFDIKTNQWWGKLVDLSDTPDTFLSEKNRQSWRLFLQDAWTFRTDWELTAGLRYYNYSDFGNTINPNVGLVWQTSPQLITKLLYGKAFRPPTIDELYAATVSKIGNSELKPETIQTLELVLDYRPTPKVQWQGNVFYSEITDAISLQPTSSGRSQAQNKGEKTGAGVALEASWWPRDHLKLQGHYNFQTLLDQNDHPIPKAPRHQGYFRTDWEFLPGWNLDLQANWTGKRHRTVGDSRPPLANYTITDLTLRYHPTQQPWEMGLSVRNVFDTDAKEPADPVLPNDLPLAGRSVWGEVRYRFPAF